MIILNLISNNFLSCDITIGVELASIEAGDSRFRLVFFLEFSLCIYTFLSAINRLLHSIIATLTLSLHVV